jgi:hypothetical protein
MEKQEVQEIFGGNSRGNCVGLIPQPSSPTKCLWIEKSIKEGQGPIRTVEASWKKNPRGNRQFVRLGRRWEHRFEMDLRYVCRYLFVTSLNPFSVNQPTEAMSQDLLRLSWSADRSLEAGFRSCIIHTSSSSQGITYPLWKPKVLCRIHKRRSLDPIISQMNTIHIFTSHVLEIQIHITFIGVPSALKVFLLKFCTTDPCMLHAQPIPSFIWSL